MGRCDLIWLESPSNPLLDVADLPAICGAARKPDNLVCVDSTFATPILQRPLERGADVVMHSTTKYLGGHSDALGGLNVVADDELGKRMQSLRSATGGVAGPFDAYLTLRGVKTLALRMQRHQESAHLLARRLDEHAKVERVFYPGLENHPGNELAKRQMDGFGGVVSFIISGGIPEVGRFMNALEVFTLAESLGGVESLIEHPAIMTHASLPAEVRAKLGIDDSLVRLSVGIEDIDDLIDELDGALNAV